jgi:hypothetical protein
LVRLLLDHGANKKAVCMVSAVRLHHGLQKANAYCHSRCEDAYV